MHQVKLSPLNMHGFIAYARGRNFDVPPVKKNRAEEVTMYRCSVCLDLHDWEEEAEDCCASSSAEAPTDDKCRCPVCAEPAWDNFDASDCCLWKDLDQPTRWKMATAVDGGSTWAEQLQIDVK